MKAVKKLLDRKKANDKVQAAGANLGVPALADDLSGRITLGSGDAASTQPEDGMIPAVVQVKEEEPPVVHNTQYFVGKVAYSSDEAENVQSLIMVSPFCPPAMIDSSWNLAEFDMVQKVYQGPISYVFHAVHKRTGTQIALKLYDRRRLNRIERHQVAREIQMHVNICHPSIISLFAAWKDHSYVYIALEWAAGGDVYTYLNARGGWMPERHVVLIILHPFLNALKYLHSKGLMHRDIKPENILLDERMRIKIADFGLSIDSTQEVANTRLGTLDYLAPEILDCPIKNNPNDNKMNPHISYSNKVDCWSCGVLAYELITGSPPFSGASPVDTLGAIRHRKVQFPPTMSNEAVDFIQRALNRDPEQRAGVADLLNHPLIQNHVAPLAEAQARAAAEAQRGGEGADALGVESARGAVDGQALA